MFYIIEFIFQVDIDGAVDMIRQNRTFLTPHVFKVANNTEEMTKRPAYIVKGKIPKDAKSFTLSLLNVEESDDKKIHTEDLHSRRKNNL